MPPVSTKLTNNDLKRLQSFLINLLQAIELLGGAYAKGLITAETTYQAAQSGSTFNHLYALI